MVKAAKVLKIIAALGLAFGATGSAQAAFDPAPVESYGIINPPGVYFGGGNANGNFNITNGGGVELALRAKTYGAGALLDGSTGVYQTNTGLSANRTPTQTPRADWNYEFSINTSQGQLHLTDYIFRLGVDRDRSANVDYSYVNPVTYFGDNPTRSNAGGIFGTQNSENFIFLNTPDKNSPTGGSPIDPFLTGLYSFELSAFAANDTSFRNALATTDIIVRVGNPDAADVPEPAGIALLGLGLLGLAAARRRKA